MTSESPPPFQQGAFLTTRWTRVCLAKWDSDDGRTALTDLCNAYYERIVAYLRRVLRDADAAREMSHAFFAEMLAGGRIHTGDRTVAKRKCGCVAVAACRRCRSMRILPNCLRRIFRTNHAFLPMLRLTGSGP